MSSVICFRVNENALSANSTKSCGRLLEVEPERLNLPHSIRSDTQRHILAKKIDETREVLYVVRARGQT